MHSARISAKRLRYLLEPLARRVPGAKGLVTQLKEVQDSLGDLHDRHVLAEEIASTRSDLSCINSDRLAGCEPGLRTLERLALEQAAVAFARFDTEWSGEHAGKFILQVERLAMSLAEGAARAAGAPVLTLGRARRVGSAGGAPEQEQRHSGRVGYVEHNGGARVTPKSS